MRFHHRRLPSFSTLLAGRIPPDEVGATSDRLQVWYNNSAEGWVDDGVHAHRGSDECFVVLHGEIVVEVDDTTVVVGSGEFCFFPRGIFHRVVEVRPPVESLMIRAPSIDDKIWK